MRKLSAIIVGVILIASFMFLAGRDYEYQSQLEPAVTHIDSTAHGVLFMYNNSGAAIAAGEPVSFSTGFVRAFDKDGGGDRDSSVFKHSVMPSDSLTDLTSYGKAGADINLFYQAIIRYFGGKVTATDTTIIFGKAWTSGTRNTVASVIDTVIPVANDSAIISDLYYEDIDSIDFTRNTNTCSVEVYAAPLFAIRPAGASEVIIGITADAIDDSTFGPVYITGIMAMCTVDGGAVADTSDLMRPGTFLKLSSGSDWTKVTTSETDTVSLLFFGTAISVENVYANNKRTRVLIR